MLEQKVLTNGRLPLLALQTLSNILIIAGETSMFVEGFHTKMFIMFDVH